MKNIFKEETERHYAEVKKLTNSYENPLFIHSVQTQMFTKL